MEITQLWVLGIFFPTVHEWKKLDPVDRKYPLGDSSLVWVGERAQTVARGRPLRSLFKQVPKSKKQKLKGDNQMHDESTVLLFCFCSTDLINNNGTYFLRSFCQWTLKCRSSSSHLRAASCKTLHSYTDSHGMGPQLVNENDVHKMRANVMIPSCWGGLWFIDWSASFLGDVNSVIYEQKLRWTDNSEC